MIIPVGYKIVDGVMVQMTLEEKVAAGQLTQEQATQCAIDDEVNEHWEYLHQTDWYTIRYAETGKAIPQDVIAKRELARQRISELAR